MKYISILLALFALLAPIPVAAETNNSSTPTQSAVQDSSILQEIKNKLKENYYKPLTDNSLNATTIDGLISSLNDPYTEYMNPDEFKSFMGEIDQNFVGLGIVIEKAKDGVLINNVYKNSPASRMGLQNGDIIIKVDGHSIGDSTMEEVQSYLLGKENTKVTLTVRRGIKELTLTGTRATIHIPLVEGKLLDGSVGYISISSFGSDTYKEFLANLTNLKNQHAKKWIIDLRGNGGGQVVASLQIMEHFIKATNNPVIKFVYGNGDEDQIGSGGSDLHLDSAIVLTDEYTASASEILAYALKNNNAALLMGEKSFGKGVMQEADTLSDGSYLKYTIAEIKSAKNESYNKIGIQPNIDLKDIPMATKQHTDQWLTIARLYQQRKTGTPVANDIRINFTNNQKLVISNYPVLSAELKLEVKDLAALNKVQVLTKSGWTAATTKNLPATELYGVGGGFYVVKSNTITYQTPTKQKLTELQKAKQVAWGKSLLKRGQIGKITVLTNTPLYKLNSNGTNLIPQPRTLKKGEELRIYTYKKGA